jgi:hypothetical protein
MELVQNQIFDEERAFYGSKNIKIIDCKFDGVADGESAFKESSDIDAKRCFFNLRYPFWHDKTVVLDDCEMTSLCRAALWYSKDITVKNTLMHGIKALRECENISIENTDIISPEFGWFSKNIKVVSSSAEGEYFMFKAENLKFYDVKFKGKYSFQYVNGAVFENCVLETKDAFWHAKDITVKNCVVKGEYLAWYSENITFENCIIYGTQPLCYCKNLKLINCEMHDADLAFELSEVYATLTSPIISIKNALAGEISLPSVIEIINDNDECRCKIILNQ